MQEYYQLQQKLLWITIAISVVICAAVWGILSLNIALNYLLGAVVGVVYLRMLAKDVEQIGVENQSSGSAKRLGLFVLLILAASQWQQLHILPVFLGFMTFKVTFVIYTLLTLAYDGENKY